MNYSAAVFAIIGLFLLLAIALVGVFRDASQSGSPSRNGRTRPERYLHIPHLPQIKQALANSDFMYLNGPRIPGACQTDSKGTAAYCA